MDQLKPRQQKQRKLEAAALTKQQAEAELAKERISDDKRAIVTAMRDTTRAPSWGDVREEMEETWAEDAPEKHVPL